MDKTIASRPVQSGRPTFVHSPMGLGDFARRITVTLLLVGLFLSIALLVWRGAHIVLEAFAGILFGIFLLALTEKVTKHTGLSHGLSLTLVVVALLLLTVGLTWLLAARLITQFGQFSQQLPQSLDHVHDWLVQFSWGNLVWEQGLQALDKASRQGQVAHALNVVFGGVNFIMTAILILFVGIFTAAEPEVYRSGILLLVPPQHRPRMEEALGAVNFNLRRWLVGQVFLMVAIGITTVIGLWILGIPMALLLGLVAGLLELIPYLGPWVSAIPALFVAMLVSPWHVVLVLLLYLGVHILEGYILAPLVQRHTILLPPALALIIQVLLGELMGVVGLFVAAPLTVTAVVLAKMLYVEDTLGHDSVNVPGEPGNEDKQEHAA
jgi:predicted PurR-regulated permease PerM